MKNFKNIKKKIFVKQTELQEYLTKTRISKENRVGQLWTEIIQNAPGFIRNELNSSPTRLIKIENSEITGAETYTFASQFSSSELSKYLNSFVIFAEKDTREIIEWKNQIHSLVTH